MNRIKELRTLRGLKQSELAEVVSVQQSTISNWENEATEIDKDSLFKLVDHFGVTTDYLLGKTDISTTVNFKSYNGNMDLKTIAERIEALAKRKYGNTNKMVDASNGVLHGSIICNMKRDNASAPNIFVFSTIAKLLETTTDYLLTGKETSSELKVAVTGKCEAVSDKEAQDSAIKQDLEKINSKLDSLIDIMLSLKTNAHVDE